MNPMGAGPALLSDIALLCIFVVTGPVVTSGFACMSSFFLKIVYDRQEALVFGERNFPHFSTSLTGYGRKP